MLRKIFNRADIVKYETEVETYTELTSQSLDSVQFVSESGVNGSLTRDIPLTNGNYWNFFKHNFYNVTSSHNHDNSRRIGYYNNFGPNNMGTNYSKFHVSASLISISQKHYGDYIVPGTFTLKDNYYSSSIDSNIKPILKDDGRGNVYSTNPYVSSSATSHLSSSDNHVGNIFYDWGFVVLKETGSWSGSVSYQDLGINNYNVKFKAKNTIYTTEYNMRVEPHELLHTSNITSRTYISGSPTYSGSKMQSPFYISAMTSSIKDGATFITTFGLYGENPNEGPLIIARTGRPIRSNGKVPITFRIKLDTVF